MNPHAGECTIAFFVARTPRGRIVLPAVEFDPELHGFAVEVENARLRRMLATELDVEQATIAEQAPEQVFGRGLVVAERPREAEEIRWKGRFLV